MNRKAERIAELVKTFDGTRQFYFLDMPQAPSSALADIFAFDGTRAIGEPSKYTITFTHPSHSLSRTEYVGKPANFVVQPPSVTRYGFTKPEPPCEVQGVVTSFSYLGSSRDQSTYEIVLESRLALLRNTPKVRFFYDVTIPDVLKQVLRENGFDQMRASVEFLKFHYAYRKHPIITQWEEDDLAFLQRLCRRSGIWFVCEPGEFSEVVVFGDDLTHYLRDDSYNMPYRPESGMHDGAVESVEALTMHAGSIPKSYFVRNYDPDNGYEPIDAGAVIHDDPTTYGEAYTYGLAYLTKEDAAEEVRLQQQEAMCSQIRYEGETNKVQLGPRCVMKITNRVLADAEHGLMIVRIHVSASRKQPYKVKFTAIPNELERPYRLPLMRETWPVIAGTITGKIASPNDYAHPFITKRGGYVVQIHADRDPRRPGANSCVMYLAKPYAGKHRTGMHFGLVDGTLVAVAFYHGNPDRPYIAHALNSSVHPDPITSDDRWLSRDTIHARNNNTIEFENWQGEEHIKVSTDHGKSQLNLGHTVGRNPERKHRGSGFELRSDLRGAIRSGGGLLLSAEMQAKASGDVVDMTGAKKVFQLTQEQADSLMQAAAAAKAEVVDLKAERQWMKDELADLKKQVIALSAPAGIGIATPGPLSVAAGRDVNTTTLAGFDVSAMKNVALAAKEAVSLFAYRMGIKVKAAQGPVQIEAQSDVMSLAAQKNMTITSGEGAVHVRADKEVMVECGGAFIEIKDGNMTLGGPGKLIFKFAGMKKDTAQMAHLSAPAFAITTVPFKTNCEAWLNGNTTAETVTPPASRVDWKQFGNAVPAAPEPPLSTAEGADTSRKADTSEQRTPDVDNDSRHEPKKPITRDPIQLQKPVSCDWTLKNLTGEVLTQSETGIYKAVDDDKNIIHESNGTPKYSGTTLSSAFSLDYDAAKKCVTATVRIKLIPVDLIKANPYGEPILTADGKKQSVPYQHNMHWTGVTGPFAGSKKINGGVVMEFRDSVGSDFDLADVKRNAERVLNSHRALLILDGCSRGASCGCRVTVKFNVELLLSIKNANVGEKHVEIYLFPMSLRADSACWSEKSGALEFQKDGSEKFIPRSEANIIAHECGHLFNFPDEYWKAGGWVHQNYINEKQELDFKTGDLNSSKQVWKIEDQRTVMGYGSWYPTASSAPYYLEYVRKHFSELSNKKWKIGYEA